MKQNKYNDLEVSDLPKENANVDELAQHVYYTVKAIRRLTLSEAKSSVPFPPTGSFINEQYVTMPNLLYNLINLVLTDNQSNPFNLDTFKSCDLIGYNRQSLGLNKVFKNDHMTTMISLPVDW